LTSEYRNSSYTKSVYIFNALGNKNGKSDVMERKAPRKGQNSTTDEDIVLPDKRTDRFKCFGKLNDIFLLL